MTFLPKEVNTDLDHLMYAGGVGVESLQPLFIWGRQGSKEKQNKRFYLIMENGVASTL